MRAFYSGRSVYRYFSTIDESRSFETRDQAFAEDLECAVELVGQHAQAHFQPPLRDGDEKLVRALRFLADEIEDAGSCCKKAETA